MFCIEGELFHRLNQLGKSKLYCISLAQKKYYYNKIQLFLISLKAFQHFESSIEDFVIEDQLKFNTYVHFSQNDLISCYNLLHSLFHQNSEILLTLENCSTFQILADVLKNPCLKSQCQKVSPNKNRKFKLSSKFLSLLSFVQRNKLNNFHLIVNEQIFLINFELFCCVSDFFFQKKDLGPQFLFSIPDVHFDYFLRFINIFQRQTLNFEEESFASWMFLIDTFGLTCLLPLIPKELLFPQNPQEAIYFLAKPFCQDFEQQFNQSISFLIQNIDRISLKQFLSLQNYSLIQLFSSNQLKISNEDFLLNAILNIIDRDINRKYLLKLIRFPFISSHLIIDLFKKDYINEIDFDDFESLKDCLFSEIGKPNSEIPFQRWKKEFKFLSRNEIEEISHILHEHLKTAERPIKQIQKIIDSNIQLDLQNQNFRQQIKKPIKENQVIKDQISAFQTQIQALLQNNDVLNNEILSLKKELNKFPVISFKQIEGDVFQNKELKNPDICDYPLKLHYLNNQKSEINEQMQNQYHRSFLFEFQINESKIERKIPFQAVNHEGLFYHLHNIYSIQQLKNIIQIKTSSDFNSDLFPKENVLI
ncbi:MAG: hypothetical protein LBC61_06725 [Candidatus Peribacteria bacterium]|jgi:hypothetical protein|nr:hypothetical protein [Candidatus Peribacteria bacterium]